MISVLKQKFHKFFLTFISFNLEELYMQFVMFPVGQPKNQSIPHVAKNSATISKQSATRSIDNFLTRNFIHLIIINSQLK